VILLLGSSGYVGSAFKKYFADKEINFVTNSIRYPIDIIDFKSYLKDNNIKSIINCSGYVGYPNVDSCEDDKIECFFSNGLLPRQVAEAASSFSIPHIFISSGCIFFDEACEQGLPPSIEFTNRDTPNFTFDQEYRSFYSGTKDLGEKLLKPFSNTSICRLRIPFNGEVNHRNYIYKIINYPKLVNCTNSLSNLDEFVDACYKISEFMQTTKFTVGAKFYNLTQPGWVTTADVVDLLKKHNIIDHKEYFSPYEEFLKTVQAPRSNCVLKSCSERSDAPFILTPVRESLENAIIQYHNNL
jgi:dTDP-4-dehydrorhamnose reductase